MAMLRDKRPRERSTATSCSTARSSRPSRTTRRVRRRAAQALQRRTRRAARQFQVGEVRASRPAPRPTTTVATVEPALSRGRRRRAADARARATAATGGRRSARRSSIGARAPKRRFAGRYPAACGERDWWVSLLDHPTYIHGMFDTYFRAAGGRFAGRWRDGVAPAGAAPVRHARIAAAVGRRPRRQQAVEQRHGAAALPHARHRARPASGDHRARDGNRARRGSRGATCACRSSCSTTVPACRARSASAPEASRGCCSPPTRAPCARSSRARSRSPRWTARVQRRFLNGTRRGSGAAQDRDARRRARARGLRHRQRGPALRRGRDRQPRERGARAGRARLPGAVGLPQRRQLAPAH